MTKTAYEKQSDRLAALKCPIHGHPMAHTVAKDGTAPCIFTCTTKGCDVRGIAQDKSGPIKLDDEFKYLVDEYIGQLPMQTHNQERGLQAADIASVALSKIAFVHRVETGSDIGIDFICELRSRRNPTGKMFYVQCKALPSTFDPGEASFSLPIKVSTARYWLEQTPPTFLMVVDVESGTLYWQDPIELLTKMTTDWRSQGQVSIPILKASGFSCFTLPPQAFIDKVQQGIARIGNALRERLYTVEKIIDKELETGANRESREVADLLLASNSPIMDAFNAIESIMEFQAAIFHKVVHMVADISSTVAKLHEDSFRKLHAIKENPWNYAEDASYVEERKMFNEAHLFAHTVGKLTDPAQLKKAIQFLVDVEFLHRESLSRELEYKMIYSEKERFYDASSDV